MTRRSLRTAIDAKCKSCIYDPFGGNGKWREQVDSCTSSNCPLHQVRPRARSTLLAEECACNGPLPDQGEAR